MPERGNVLLGQKKGFPPKLFSGDIHEITFSNGDYADSPWQGLPDKLSLWGFAYGDILHDGLPRIITYTGSNQLTVLKPDGSEEWTSSEIYGAVPIMWNIRPKSGKETFAMQPIIIICSADTHCRFRRGRQKRNFSCQQSRNHQSSF